MEQKKYKVIIVIYRCSVFNIKCYNSVIRKGVYGMSSMQERAELRRTKLTLNKVDLHSQEHHSFHTHLNTKDAWELLARLSQEAWIEKTGTIVNNRVDKSICKFISTEQKV